MRAWIHSSLLGVPSPERTLPSVSRIRRLRGSANAGERRVGSRKVSVPAMRALACPNAFDRPKCSMMRFASATSRRSAGSTLGALALRGARRVARPMRSASMLPELARGDARAFGHRSHLGPNDVRIHGRLADPGAEAAVAAAHHVLPAHELRVATYPLRDELWMLDEVRFRLDHTR